MRISDWSSDVCSSDLLRSDHRAGGAQAGDRRRFAAVRRCIAQDLRARGGYLARDVEQVLDAEDAAIQRSQRQAVPAAGIGGNEIGRGAGRERGWQYEENPGVGGAI